MAAPAWRCRFFATNEQLFAAPQPGQALGASQGHRWATGAIRPKLRWAKRRRARVSLGRSSKGRHSNGPRDLFLWAAHMGEQGRAPIASAQSQPASQPAQLRARSGAGEWGEQRWAPRPPTEEEKEGDDDDDDDDDLYQLRALAVRPCAPWPRLTNVIRAVRLAARSGRVSRPPACCLSPAARGSLLFGSPERGHFRRAPLESGPEVARCSPAKSGRRLYDLARGCGELIFGRAARRD